MDEAELTQALQADLNFFKVKVQVKHREDQLHILISRSQKNDVDYTVLFDTVQNSLAQKRLSTETFTVYGRVFGAKQPEWQGNGELLEVPDTAEFDRAPELDYVELTDALAGDGMIDLPDIDSQVISTPTTLQVPDLDTQNEQSLSSSLEMPEVLNEAWDDISLEVDADLEMPNLSSGEITDSIQAQMSDFETPDDFDMPEFTASGDFDMPEISASGDFDMPEISASGDFDMPEFTASGDFDMPEISASGNSDVSEISASEDFGMAEYTTNRQEQPTSENATPASGNGKKYVGAIALLGAVAVAGGGWFMFDRSAQEQKLTEAQAVVAKTIDPQQLAKLDALQDAHAQLKKAETLLEEIPNRPGSYHEQAQAQLQLLKPKLQELDAKLNIEKPAIDKLEKAKQLAKDASIIVQNPPHKSEVWQTAQNQWQESLKLLESIPKNSLAAVEVQQKLELYRSNYTTITGRLQTQKQIDFAATLWPNGVTPDLQVSLKQLKTSKVPYPEFINNCISTIRPRLNAGELQQRGFQPDTFSKVFCEYVSSAN